MCSHAKRESHVHSTRVTLHRRVEKLLDFRKRDHLIKLAIDLRLLHSEDCTVEIDVFTTGQLRMKASADFEQRADTPVNFSASTCGPGYTRQDSEEGALAGAIQTDDADNLAAFDFAADVL